MFRQKRRRNSLRNSHQRCFIKKHVLKNFTKSTENHLCHRLFFLKVHYCRFENLSICLICWCKNSILKILAFLNFSHTWRTHISKSKSCFNMKSSTYYFHMKKKSTFTWDPKWTQTALKCSSVYMAICMEISLRQLSKQ